MKKIKLKDSVDFNELIKFDYKRGEDTVGVPYGEYGKKTPRKDNVIKIFVDEKDLRFAIIVGRDREIYLSISAKGGFSNHIFFEKEIVKPYIEDLINANIVEEVWEDDNIKVSY